MRLNFIFIFLFLSPFYLESQILPVESSKLNYRLVGFSFPFTSSGQYRIEIAKGNFQTIDSFRKNVIVSKTCKSNKEIIELPEFGKVYTWRTVNDNADDSANHKLHHFSTRIIPNVDTTVFRLKILKHAEKYKDDYVFIDCSNALYDMEGNPVWFPFINMRGLDSVMPLRDVKLSPAGTVTLLTGSQGFEINCNGDVLWRAPDNGLVSGSESENYHHQLSRLDNGHYMILGNQWALCKKPDAKDTNMHIIPFDKAKWDSDNNAYMKVFLGTLVEYDHSGKVIWSWYSSKYFVGSDVDNYRDPKDKYNVDVHENAFYFDEKNQVIYLSFKNINRLVKIKYPSGEVLNSYGEIYQPGQPEKGNGLFCGQHSCLPMDGLLYIYNNNSCGPLNLPNILGLEEPTGNGSSLKKAWEYTCTIDDSVGSKEMSYSWASGGNIIEMPDKSLFVCMGGSYSKSFIINKQKEISWSALPERWQPKYNDWIPVPGYRASIIDRKSLETFIWNEQAKEQQAVTPPKIISRSSN